jgi:TPR repeat protein
MPARILSCISIPDATIKSVPIYDYAIANEGVEDMAPVLYHPCCGKYICSGCVKSFCESGNMGSCPFCKAERLGKADDEKVEELMKRVAVNDAGAISALADCYYNEKFGFLQDQTKGMELLTRAAELGLSHAHFLLGNVCYIGRDSKKEKFHYEAAAMAGHEVARYNLGTMEYDSKNYDRAVKHWTIAASSGCFRAMHALINFQGIGSRKLRKLIDSILKAYNNSCAEMRSEARDAYFRVVMRMNECTNHT